MLKRQKTLNFDCLQTSVLQGQKYALSLPFAFFFVFMFSPYVCQKARPNDFDFLTCLVERLFYAVLSVDYVFSQSRLQRPNVWPNRLTRRPVETPR